MWLSAEQLYRLTQRKTKSAQARKLRALGIDFMPDGDGRPLVLESLIEKLGGGKADRVKPAQEPNFGALSGPQT